MRLDFPFKLARVGQRVAVHFLAHRVQNFAGSADAQVGGKQGRLQVLEQGRIVEMGTHPDLVERGGAYADIFQQQALEEELARRRGKGRKGKGA